MTAGQELRPIVGFDRLTFWFDMADPQAPLDALKECCRDVKLQPGQAPFGARWKSKLELYQPTLEALQLLDARLPRIVSAKITYAEIAFDIPAGRKAARRLLEAFLGAARMMSQRQTVVRSSTVWYFGRKATTPNSRKQKPLRSRHRLVAYADRPSKLLNTTSKRVAFHVEWRASGSAALADLGLVTIADLIAFDHAGFWDRHVRLYALPKRTELGRLLAQEKKAKATVSGTALRKRALVWMQSATRHNQFVLHNALRGQPGVAKRLKTVSWGAWWSSVLQDVPF